MGRIINEALRACAPKDKGSLYFLGLITQLCLIAGVPQRGDDELTTNYRPINNQAIGRILREAKAANIAIIVQRETEAAACATPGS